MKPQSRIDPLHLLQLNPAAKLLIIFLRAIRRFLIGFRALIVVDMEKGFMPGFSLPVEGGPKIIPTLNALIVSVFFDFVVFSRDLHPEGHKSFVEQGGPFPRHCVKGTIEVDFADGLRVLYNLIVHKATTLEKEAFDAFDADDVNLAQWLRARNVRIVYVSGVATEFCDEATGNGAVSNGFETYLFTDAVAAVKDDDGAVALKRMTKNKIKLVTSAKVLGRPWWLRF